jgi:hypothetical protein
MADHYCSEHDAVFFKRGKMRGYAHPIEDTGQWCNEEKEDADPKRGTSKPQSQARPQQDDDTKNQGMSKEEWREKDRITRESFHRQKALEQSVLLVNSGKVELRALLPCADRFVDWLNGEKTPLPVNAENVYHIAKEAWQTE